LHITNLGDMKMKRTAKKLEKLTRKFYPQFALIFPSLFSSIENCIAQISRSDYKIGVPRKILNDGLYEDEPFKSIYKQYIEEYNQIDKTLL